MMNRLVAYDRGASLSIDSQLMRVALQMVVMMWELQKDCWARYFVQFVENSIGSELLAPVVGRELPIGIRSILLKLIKMI